MAENTESTGAVAGWTASVGAISRVLSSAVTIIRWAVLLLVAAGWLAFWANLARLHLSQGDLQAAVVSAAPIVLPPALLVLVLRDR